MTGSELRALRELLGLSIIQFGRALGYEGNDSTISRDIRRYEIYAEVPPGVQERAAAITPEGSEDLLLALASSRPRMGGEHG